jgi:hypothetical protein
MLLLLLLLLLFADPSSQWGRFLVFLVLGSLAYGVHLTKWTSVYICLHLFTSVYFCLHLFTFVYIFSQMEQKSVPWSCNMYGTKKCSIVLYGTKKCSIVLYGTKKCSIVMYGTKKCSKVPVCNKKSVPYLVMWTKLDLKVYLNYLVIWSQPSSWLAD